jgi:ribosomal-protein-alanine N-acetyltransferase
MSGGERIVTKRLILREFEEEDWEPTFHYQRRPEYLQFYPWSEITRYDVQDFVGRFISWRHTDVRHKHQLAITLASTGELIGNVGIRAEFPGAFTAEIGFEVAPDHWGQGYATEAGAAMIDFAFRKLQYHRIEAQCVAENRRSARVLERIGMLQEGRLREAEFFRDRWWDLLLFGTLASDHFKESSGGSR